MLVRARTQGNRLSGIPTVALIGLGGLALASLFLFLASRRIRTRRHGVRRGGAW